MTDPLPSKSFDAVLFVTKYRHLFRQYFYVQVELFKRNRIRHCLSEIFTQQTQAPANRNARSKQWQPWLAACQRKRLRFLRFSFTQRTQRKQLRLNGNRALDVELLRPRRTKSYKSRLKTVSILRRSTPRLHPCYHVRYYQVFMDICIIDMIRLRRSLTGSRRIDSIRECLEFTRHVIYTVSQKKRNIFVFVRTLLNFHQF